MTKRKTTAALRAEMRALGAELNARMVAERRANNLKHVGKCYTHPNGSSEGTWRVYLQVRSVDSEGDMHALRFQTTAGGKVVVECDHVFDYVGDLEKITSNEFCLRWQQLRVKLQHERVLL